MQDMSELPRLADRELDLDADRARWTALVVLCAGMLMIVLDVTIVNVALPKTRLVNIQPGHPCKKLLMPSIDFHPTLLIIRQRQPLISPRARTDCI